ncbi:cupin domain-containing protein [Rhodopseudomonas palustris]|uniref:Uncharacterized protein containing double-stranded beta helix domain-like n=1 Tax=Rhodopseudomonas palustris (strain BisB18) TaxID=316056 RepID=Q21AQ8_RHOPB
MTDTRDHIKPLTYLFEDDGLVPNNALPLVVYKRAIEVPRTDPARSIEELFGRNGWGQLWRDGVFDFQHYHATVHEALGVARGHALVLFGGERGEAVQLGIGDVAILPAGTGHKSLFASHDFQVVGAYPPGDTMQVTRPTPDSYRRALQTIPQVPVPASDPVFGEAGPLTRLWR